MQSNFRVASYGRSSITRQVDENYKFKSWYSNGEPQIPIVDYPTLNANGKLQVGDLELGYDSDKE